MAHSPHILLINPWITDFAAYNFWIKPLGLLRIGSSLRQRGFRVTLIDCLDFSVRKKQYGQGKFSKIKIDKPLPLKLIRRNYSRYGITEEMLVEKFSRIDPPDVIGITSGMTYWYPGLFNTIRVARLFFRETPIVLGGIYATLCYDHASRYSGADLVIRGQGEIRFLKLIFELTETGSLRKTQNPSKLDHFEFHNPNSGIRNGKVPYPCFDLYLNLDVVCISTSKGCPFDCNYCASRLLDNDFSRRDPLDVTEEIEYWTTRYQVKNITFYDDALLIDPYSHIIPILKEIIRRDVRCNFHAPNGLHVREINEEVAVFLCSSGFKTIRLGFETCNETEQKETGGKVTNEDFIKAVKNLRKAGFAQEQIGTYILVGLPDQRAEDVQGTIRYVREIGARPIIVEYSPVPGTALFERAKKRCHFDIENEPLFHNNSILPCQWEGLTLNDYRRLKDLADNR